MANIDDKRIDMAHSEDVESARYSKDDIRRASFKHGDRALAFVGESRIEVSEEDVCLSTRFLRRNLSLICATFRTREFATRLTKSSSSF